MSGPPWGAAGRKQDRRGRVAPGAEEPQLSRAPKVSLRRGLVEGREGQEGASGVLDTYIDTEE